MVSVQIRDGCSNILGNFNLQDIIVLMIFIYHWLFLTSLSVPAYGVKKSVSATAQVATAEITSNKTVIDILYRDLIMHCFLIHCALHTGVFATISCQSVRVHATIVKRCHLQMIVGKYIFWHYNKYFDILQK